MHEETLEPPTAVEKCPAGQSLQLMSIFAVFSSYFPASQASQAACPALFSKYPAGQAVQDSCPAAEKWPLGQLLQLLDSVDFSVLPKLPAGHSLQADVPVSSAYLPLAQPLHVEDWLAPTAVE